MMVACDNCHDEVEHVAELGSHSDDEYGPCSYCAACLSQALARAQGRERTIGERLDILPTPSFEGVDRGIAGLGDCATKDPYRIWADRRIAHLLELDMKDSLRSRTPRQFARLREKEKKAPAFMSGRPLQQLLVLVACLPSERSQRAFSVWCARQSEGSWTNPATRRAVEGAEESTKSELLALYSDATRACKKLAASEGSTREQVLAALGGAHAAHPNARQGAFLALSVCQAEAGRVLEHLVEVLGP